MSYRTRGHQTVELVGNQYVLFFEGTHHCYEKTTFRDHYESKTTPFYYWSGTARLTLRSTGQWWVFEFRTNDRDARSPLSSHPLLQVLFDIHDDSSRCIAWWRPDDVQRQRLEEFFQGRSKYKRDQDERDLKRILGFDTPKPVLIDLLGHRIAQEVTTPAIGRTVHYIEIPILTMSELRAAGVTLMLPDGKPSLAPPGQAAFQSGLKEAD